MPATALTRLLVAAPAAVAAVALVARSAAAQDAPAGAPADARWQAWIGCWSPAADSAGTPDAAAPVTCVAPAGGSAVEVTTVAGGKVTGRERVDASGAQRRFERDGCTGWERGEFSPDGRRVYLRTELTCVHDVRRTGDAVLAFTRAGEWVDVRGASVNGYTGVRTVRLRPAVEPAGLPAEVASALRGRSLAVETARVAAASPVGSADVIEVTRRAGAPVAAAWLAELRQRFALDGRRLAELADAGVPGSVTDVMVATTYPQRFALDPSGAQRAERPARDDGAGGRPGPVALLSPVGGPFVGAWGNQWWAWNSLAFSPLALNNWGMGFPPGFGFGPGFVPGGGFWGAGPVVVVRGGGGPGARATRSGYSQGGSATTGSAFPTDGSRDTGWNGGPATSRAGAGSSGGYSGGSAPSGGSSAGSGGYSGGSSSSGRTASPRP